LGIEIQLTLNYPPKHKKVYSIFSKIAGLGSAHKIFRNTIYKAQTASCLTIVRLHIRKVFVGFDHTHDL